MRTPKGKWIVLLLIGAFVFLLSGACRHNWLLHARFDMLLRGYVFCHVEIPPDLSQLAEPKPTGFISALVYQNSTCIGSLNRYGTFVLRNETAASQDEREAKRGIVLFVLEYMFGAIFVGASLALLWDIVRGRWDLSTGGRANGH